MLDVYSARILVLAPGGQVQRVLALPADAGFVSDIAVDFSGTVVVLDSIGRRLYAAAKDATAFTPLGGDLSAYVLTLPSSLTASKGAFFIAEGTGGTIVNLGRDGTFLSRQLSAGRTEGSLEHPSQMCINERDDVFLADRDNSRIQVFALIR